MRVPLYLIEYNPALSEAKSGRSLKTLFNLECMVLGAVRVEILAFWDQMIMENESSDLKGGRRRVSDSFQTRTPCFVAYISELRWNFSSGFVLLINFSPSSRTLATFYWTNPQYILVAPSQTLYPPSGRSYRPGLHL